MRMTDDSSSVAVFADHEVIKPPNDLRKAISTAPQAEGDDPIARGRPVERVLELDGP
jgi:hypothetical protein